MEFAPQNRVDVKLECLRMIATLKLDRAKSRLIAGFVDSYLKLTALENQQFQQKIDTLDIHAKEEIMAKRTSWREDDLKEGLLQGRQEGRQEGREQGRHEAAAELVILQMSRRFGKLDRSVLDDISSLSLRRLQELAQALLDFTSPEDLARWLSENKAV